MRSKEILNLKVVDIASGTTLGTVTGTLIDGDDKRMVALQIGRGLLSRPEYAPFECIKAIENDVVMITSEASVVGRGTFKGSGMVDKLSGRKVLTTDGRDIGNVQDYDIDTANGEVTSVSVAAETAKLGGLLHSAREAFEVSRNQIVTLGDSVVVDKSVADAMEAKKAA